MDAQIMTLLINALSLLLCVIYVQAFSIADCPHPSSDYFFNDVCYWNAGDVNIPSVNFYSALRVCQLTGGSMATLDDQATYDSVWAHYGGLEGYWVGIYDAGLSMTLQSGVPREWVMVNGRRPSMFKWGPGQPDGYPDNPSGSVQQCIKIETKDAWADEDCGDNLISPVQMKFLCGHDLTLVSHTCETTGDCLSHMYERVARAWFGSAMQLIYSLQVLAIGQCGVICNLTPDCETFLYDPATRECKLLGRVLALRTVPLMNAEIYTKYKYFNYVEGDSVVR